MSSNIDREKSFIAKSKSEGKKNSQDLKKISSTSNTNRKYYKITLRKLIASKDFKRNEFEQLLFQNIASIGLNPSFFRIDHFVEGKISRKRGPISGASFITVTDEDAYHSFLANCSTRVPFFTDEISNQPDVLPALFQRVFKYKEKIDKYANTYEADPEFLAFKERLEKPPEKPPIAEIQVGSSMANSSSSTGANNTYNSLLEKMKNNPLLSYLKERAEKRIQERRFERDQRLRDKGGKKSSSNKKDERKEIVQNKKKKKKSLFDGEEKIKKKKSEKSMKKKTRKEDKNAQEIAMTSDVPSNQMLKKEPKKKNSHHKKERNEHESNDGAQQQKSVSSQQGKQSTRHKNEKRNNSSAAAAAVASTMADSNHASNLPLPPPLPTKILLRRNAPNGAGNGVSSSAPPSVPL